MTRRNRKIIAISLTALCLAMAGCAENSSVQNEDSAAETQFTSPAPASSKGSLKLGDGTFIDAGEVDRKDADDVASSAARIAHSWDTEFDSTETDGLLRAEPLMSNDYADTIQAPVRNASQAEWLSASEHQAYSVPSVGPVASDAHASGYGPNRKAMMYTVTWNWVGRDGETVGSDQRRSVEVFLERTSEKSDWNLVGFVSTGTNV